MQPAICEQINYKLLNYFLDIYSLLAVLAINKIFKLLDILCFRENKRVNETAYFLKMYQFTKKLIITEDGALG